MVMNFKEDEYREIIDLMCLNSEYEECNNFAKEFDVIRKLYSVYIPKILSGENVSIKLLKWRFSHIEIEAYNHIRSLKSLNVYPQLPVSKYFLDFACPIRKIGIELDGKEFHDKLRDAKRDLELHNLGWKIFRIEGFRCFSSLRFDFDNPFDFWDISDNNRRWFEDSLEGILTAISITYFGESGYNGYKELSASICLKYQSIKDQH